MTIHDFYELECVRGGGEYGCLAIGGCSQYA